MNFMIVFNKISLFFSIGKSFSQKKTAKKPNLTRNYLKNPLPESICTVATKKPA